MEVGNARLRELLESVVCEIEELKNEHQDVNSLKQIQIQIQEVLDDEVFEFSKVEKCPAKEAVDYEKEKYLVQIQALSSMVMTQLMERANQK